MLGRSPTRRLDEVKVMVMAADRLAELVKELAAETVERYDYGTENLIRDLRIMAGQR